MRFALPLCVVFSLSAMGCFHAGDRPVVVVTASYPGADAQVVADTVAAPIEQQINGVENMAQMESELRNDGSYIARVWFRPGADAMLGQVLIQNRLALAKPVLPDAVQRSGMVVKLELAKAEDKNRVAIALENRGSVDTEALQRLSAAVLKRLSAEGAILNPVVFPGPAEKHPGVYRHDMYPAVRISGLPPAGKTAESAAARSVELAEEVRKSQDHPGGFTVVNLSAQ